MHLNRHRFCSFALFTRSICYAPATVSEHPLAFAPLPPPKPYAEIVGLNLAARRVRRRVVSALWEAVEPGKSWDRPNAGARVTALCRLADIYSSQSVPQQVPPPTVVMDSPRALH